MRGIGPFTESKENDQFPNAFFFSRYRESTFLLKLQFQIWRCTSLFISWHRQRTTRRHNFLCFLWMFLRPHFWLLCVCVWCFFLTHVSRVVYASVWIVHSQQQWWLRIVVHTCEVLYRGRDQWDSIITLAPPGFYVRPYECVHTRTYVFVHSCICINVYMFVYMYMYVQMVCMYVWLSRFKHSSSCTQHGCYNGSS